MSATFELAGPNEGKTVNYGGYQFLRGVYTFETDRADIDGLVTYLARAYNAHPVGSPALAAARAAYSTLTSPKLSAAATPPAIPAATFSTSTTPTPDLATRATDGASGAPTSTVVDPLG